MMTVAPARPRPPWASKHSCPPASSHGRWVSRSGTAAARPADPVDASVASPCGWRPPPRESPSSGRPATRGVLKLQDDDRRRRETRAAAAARGAHFRGGTASRLARRVGLRGDAALLRGLKCDLRLGIAGRPRRCWPLSSDAIGRSSMARCREKHDRCGSDGRHPGLAGSDVDLGQPSTAEHGWRQGLVWEASDGGRTGAALPAYTRMGRRRHVSAWGRGRVRDPPVGTRGHGSAGRTGEPRCP
jgi:hypothetical protein